MKSVALCVLVAAYLAVPSYSEPFFMELPGYAKTVMGAYGNNLVKLTDFITYVHFPLY